ncbi:STAS domain-containing protein [Kitasatospora sp. NPDC093550]|uniref:STAS domain-containing protein n=1 Tax=Kitasatospora sp. NPDC093550 TaxID=3364089 RepID=UPI0037F9DDB1
MRRPSEEPREPDGKHASGGLRVAVVDEPPLRTVTVAGELDHDTADGLRAALAAPYRDGFARILVDLADLRFCDSTGLNVLLRARLDADAAGWRLALVGPNPVVARLFAITGADTVLRIHQDLDAALKELAADPEPADPARSGGSADSAEAADAGDSAEAADAAGDSAEAADAGDAGRSGGSTGPAASSGPS